MKGRQLVGTRLAPAMSFVLPRRRLLAQLPAGARSVSAPPSQPLARPSSKKHRVKPAKKPSDELPLQALQAIGQSKPTALAGRLKVVSLASCDSFDLAALLQGLKAAQLLPGALNLVGSAIYIPRYSVAAAKVEGDGMEESPETGELFIFEGGSIVGWGFPSPRGVETFLRKVIRGGDSSSGTSPFIEKGRALETEMEVLSYVVDPSAPYQMLGDIVRRSPRVFWLTRRSRSALPILRCPHRLSVTATPYLPICWPDSPSQLASHARRRSLSTRTNSRASQTE